jgi:anthranilate synthase/aminodeoxychorismate synthase-like glutamine amidotransferase
MLDNYDSFTYNLVQYLDELGAKVQVFRNDAITVDAVLRLAPTQIVVSPGPCTPNEAGISVPLIRRFAGKVPILGVCLGHQAIGQAFGGRIVRAQRVMHGKLSPVTHDGRGVFAGVPAPFAVTRCLAEADAQAQASLRNAEAAAGTRAREIDNATGRPGANAALAKTLRTFADYRTTQCDYVKALYASGAGGEQAGLGCRVDLTRRRVRELQP